jgi:type IX secretion system PorP/SprF family membrane protein
MYLAKVKISGIKTSFSMNLFTRGAFVILLIFTVAAKAQDPHFSQFNMSPLTLNPALTGEMDGSYRVGAIYRNQYGSVTIPYVTPSVFVDGDLFKGCNSKSKSYLGIGLLILNDQAGDGDLQNLSIMLSLAYHQALDEDGFWHLSVGLQGGYTMQSVNLNALYFPSEYNPNTQSYNNSGGPPQPLTGNDNYPDFAAGIDVDGSPSRYSQVTFGVATYHIFQPVETFEGSNNTLTRKYVAHVSATFGINNKLYLFPSAIYLLQQPNQELNVGTDIGFNFSQLNGEIGTIFYVGGFYRVTGNDAIIPSVGFMVHGLQVGFAYDVNTSTLQVASHGNGAYEVGLIFIGNFCLHKPPAQYYCPHFY